MHALTQHVRGHAHVKGLKITRRIPFKIAICHIYLVAICQMSSGPHGPIFTSYIVFCVFLGFTQWVTLPLQQYQLTNHPSTGSLRTCIRPSKYSRIKQSDFLLMANTKLAIIKTKFELYLIGLAQGHMIFMSSISVEESPRQMFNMYSKHLKLISSQQSLFQRWYQLGGQYSSSFKS